MLTRSGVSSHPRIYQRRATAKFSSWADCQTEVLKSLLALGFLPRGLFMWQLTLSEPPRKHQCREYDSRTEVKISCNIIMEVTSHNLCVFYWLETSHTSLPTLKEKGSHQSMKTGGRRLEALRVRLKTAGPRSIIWTLNHIRCLKSHYVNKPVYIQTSLFISSSSANNSSNIFAWCLIPWFLEQCVPALLLAPERLPGNLALYFPHAYVFHPY